MSGVAVFDVNETTLALTPVRAVVDELVGPEGGFAVWFQRLLQLSMTITTIGDYADFPALARSALDAVAGTGGRRLADGDWDRVAAALGSLEAHPDVADGLSRLRDRGWTTIALTNSTLASVTAGVGRAGLAPLFDHVLSVESVRAFKPAPAAYRHAAAVAGTTPSQMWMVACHDWDLAGARAVGFSTAFVRRPGTSFAGSYAPPDITVADFGDLAERLVAR